MSLPESLRETETLQTLAKVISKKSFPFAFVIFPFS
jgi:hypothetical protein